ncbi:MAG TPA: RDD family protein [Acidimicrobiia bacterium]|nr:RDD family protein [Acidimicrobiia bacterium]
MTDEPIDPQDPQPMPVEPARPTTGIGAPADLGARVIARVIDGALLSAVFFIILVPFVIGAMFAEVSGFGMFGGFGGGSFVSGLIFAALTIGYFAFMESNQGQTVGKMAMGIKVEGPGGRNPTMEEALKRNAWLALSVIPVLGGLAQLAVMIYILVTISNSVTNQGWHDEFAGGTQVVKAK